MLQFFVKFWKDSVFSKVIATGIILAIGYIFTKISKVDFTTIGNYILSKLTTSFSINLWVILLFSLLLIALVAFCVFVHIRNKSNNREENIVELIEDDIYAKIVAWWPKAEGMNPDDVAIDFQELEKELSLPKGSVAKCIDKAARLDNYKIKVRGQNNAVYEYDFDGIGFNRKARGSGLSI